MGKAASASPIGSVVIWALLPYLTAGASPQRHLGRRFAAAFVQQELGRGRGAAPRLLLLGRAASVAVTAAAPRLRLALRDTPPQPLLLRLPPQAELRGSRPLPSAVAVESSDAIAAAMLSENRAAAGAAALLPVPAWGAEYRVVTPGAGGQRRGQFAVVAGDRPTQVQVHLTAAVVYGGRPFARGAVLGVPLAPRGAAQIQSAGDLSGSRVVADGPVAVFAGLACAAGAGPCDHAVEQLPPVSGWGATFVVPPLPFAGRPGAVYVSADRAALVTARSGGAESTREVRPGQAALYGLRAPNALAIAADAAVQVVLFADGAADGAAGNGTLLMTIPAVSSYCGSYTVVAMDGYANYALLVAESAETSGLTLDGEPLAGAAWQRVPGTNYSWAGLSLGERFGARRLRHRTAAFGALALGVRGGKAYGMEGACDGDPCQALKCRPKESCKAEEGKPKCAPDFMGTCVGNPAPRFQTFDGAAVDVGAGCAVTLAKYCGREPDLVPFAVEEEPSRGPLEGSVTNVYVYGFNISIRNGNGGEIQVNGEPVALPAALSGARIRTSLSEGRVALRTDFGLQVARGADGSVVVAVPSSYSGATCGLCGNFNGDAGDEMARPDGSAAAGTGDWVRSWRDPACRHAENGPENADFGALGTARSDRCSYNNRSYAPGEEFWGDRSCRRRCRCGSGGRARCRPSGCEAHEECAAVGGLARCRAAGALRCIATGDPHYTTFDGRRFDFQGTCVYQLAALCAQKRGLVPFNVTVENHNRGSRAVSFTKSVTLQIYGDTITMSQEQPGKAEVNGLLVELPFSHPGGLFQLYRSGAHGFARAASGLRVSFDWHSYARVLLPAPYAGRVCGLCGDADGDAANDASTPIDQPDLNDNQLGDSWRVGGAAGCSAGAAAGCPEERRRLYRGRRFCGVMGDPRGPFRGCHGVLDPAPFVGDCAFDACQYGGHREALCRAVAVYAAECQSRGAGVAPWRTAEFCGLSCPPNSHYELCGPPCPATCGVTNVTGGVPNGVFNGVSNVFNGVSNVFNGVSNATDGVPNGVFNGVSNVPSGVFNVTDGVPDGFSNVPNGVSNGFSNVFNGVPNVFNGVPNVNDGVPNGFSNVPNGATNVTHGVPNGVSNGVSNVPSGVSNAPNGVFNGVSNAPNGASNGISNAPNAVPNVPNDVPNVPNAACPSTSCSEGCFCDAGFARSGSSCVPLSSCGCWHRGRYHQPGALFQPSCSQRCLCQPGGAVRCREAPCGPHEDCGLRDGAFGCHPRRRGRLALTGDPRLVSFDGKGLDVRGVCGMVAARVCAARAGPDDFAVLLERRAVAPGGAAPVTRVTVEAHGHRVTVEGGAAAGVTVDGERAPLPLATPSGSVRVTREGAHVSVAAAAGMRLLFTPGAFLLLDVPGVYRGRLCGLGGNFNGDPGDDFRLPDGSPARDAEEFVAAWTVPRDGESCGAGCAGGGCGGCGDAGAERAALEACGLLREPRGPFGPCHPLLPPGEFLGRCVREVCGAGGDPEALCRALGAYAAACQAGGGRVEAWRTEEFCPLRCPPHSHYELCTRSCEHECAALAAPVPCAWGCLEGCECDDGFLWDGDRCVGLEECGCVHQGRYIKVGDTVVSNNCSTRCHCHPSRGLVCEATECPPDQSCVMGDGAQRCARSRGQCRLSPGASLATFDGAAGRLPASGTYKMAALCDERSPHWFKVAVEVNECRDDAVRAAAAVLVFFREAVVAVNGDMEVWVNGLFVRPPLAVSEAVAVSAAGGNVTVAHAAGVAVLFGPAGEVTVTVGAALAGRLCAPCGDFNGDAADDLRLPDGRAAAGITEVVDAWKAKDFVGWRVPRVPPDVGDAPDHHSPPSSAS